MSRSRKRWAPFGNSRGSTTLESVVWVGISLLVIAMFVEFQIAFNRFQNLDSAKWQGLKVAELDGGLSDRARSTMTQALSDAGMDPTLATITGTQPPAPYGTDVTITITYPLTLTQYNGDWTKNPLTIQFHSYGHTTSEYVP